MASLQSVNDMDAHALFGLAMDTAMRIAELEKENRALNQANHDLLDRIARVDELELQVERLKKHRDFLQSILELCKDSHGRMLCKETDDD